MKTTVRYDVFWFELIFTALWGGFAFTGLDAVTEFMKWLSFISYTITGMVMIIIIFVIIILRDKFVPQDKLNSTPKIYMVGKFIVVGGAYISMNIIPMIYSIHFGISEFGYDYMSGLLIIKLLFLTELVVFFMIPRLLHKN